MSIFDYFKELTLTGDQKNALLKIDIFLKSNQQIFILKGYAGTGKTTILKGLSDYLKAINRLEHIMAPTGRAAMVIKLKTKYPATTIHKSLYDLERLKTEKYIDKDGNETFKFYFDFALDTMDVNKVCIFDEASMISNVFSEQEFFRFGSGYLLNDILKHYNPNNTTNTKLIFVGDPAQLPPVGSNRSLALEKSFFESNDLLADEVEMTEVLRQRECSGILENAKYYRELIFSDVVSENELKLDFEDVEQISVEEVATVFTDISPLPNAKNCIIITYSNALAKTYNKIIRETYFPDYKSIQPGDILQVVKNNYSNQQIELLNGDFVKVLSIADDITYQSAKIKKKNGKDVLIKHAFRNVQIMNVAGEILDIQILDSFLNSKHRGLTSDETKALYINFIMRYENRTGGKANKKSKEFKEEFRSDPYYNALQVKYGYAITGHKSQGGEWTNVIVDFNGRIGISQDVLRWNYTTLTRASEKLHVINPPKLQQVDFLKIKHVAIGKIKKTPKGSIIYPEVEPTPYHDIHSHPAKRLKYFEILKIVDKNAYSIESVSSYDYIDKYTLRSDDKIIVIDIIHDAEGIFSSYRSSVTDNDSTELLKAISKVNPWEYHFFYQTDNKLLEIIYQNVLSAMQGLNIQIINIDDSKKIDFHVDYYFRTNAQIAYLQIYFNKNEIVTSLIAKSMLGEKDMELRRLINHLKKTNK